MLRTHQSYSSEIHDESNDEVIVTPTKSFFKDPEFQSKLLFFSSIGNESPRRKNELGEVLPRTITSPVISMKPKLPGKPQKAPPLPPIHQLGGSAPNIQRVIDQHHLESPREKDISNSQDSDNDVLDTQPKLPSTPPPIQTPPMTPTKSFSSIRVFVWDMESGQSVALSIRDDWTLETMLTFAEQKLNPDRKYKHVFYKRNKSEILQIDDIRDNDELLLSPYPFGIPTGETQSNSSDEALKSPKITVRRQTSRRTPQKCTVIKEEEEVSSTEEVKVVKPRLVRAESDAALLDRALDDQRKEALEGLKEQNVLSYLEIANVIYGTRIERRHFNEDFGREFTRAKSLLDIKMLEVLPQEIMKKTETDTETRGSNHSSDSALSAIEFTDDDDDEEYKFIRRQYHKLGKDMMFDLEDEESRKAIDPLLISDHEVFKRMREEEKQDLSNLELDDEGGVKSGTLRALVRRLISHLQDPDFIEAFLLTYDIFIDHPSLLRTLILLFRSPLSEDSTINNISALSFSSESSESDSFRNGSSSPRETQMSRKIFVIQYRIITVICDWVKLRYESLRMEEDFVKLFNRFVTYITKIRHTNVRKLSQRLLKSWKDARKARHTIKRNLQVAKPIRPDMYVLTPFTTVLTVPPPDLARQLTVMEQDLFGRVHLSEYVSFLAKDTDKAPHLNHMIKRFNRISFWVATMILNRKLCTSTKQRAQIISHLALVMEELRKLGNFSSMLQIFSAFNMSSVARLNKTWSYVSQKTKNIIKDVEKMFDGNYREYRTLIEICDPPCIPIQEVVFRDLTFIEESPDILENGWINFEKMFLLGRTYKQLKKFQSVQYDFRSNNDIYAWALSYDIMIDTELYDESIAIEPLDHKSKLKKKVRTPKKEKTPTKKSSLSRSSSGISIQDKLSSQSNWSPLKSDEFVNTYQIPPPLFIPENFDKFYAHMTSLFATETLDFCRDVVEWWFPLNFEDNSPENCQLIKDTARRLYAEYVSESSDRVLSLEGPSVKRMKEKLLATQHEIPSRSMFDEVIYQVVSQIKTHFTNGFRLAK